MSKGGVTKIPRKLPKAELNIAAASFPPAARVRMAADDTGGGRQHTTSTPRNMAGSIPRVAKGLCLMHRVVKGVRISIRRIQRIPRTTHGALGNEEKAQRDKRADKRAIRDTKTPRAGSAVQLDLFFEGLNSNKINTACPLLACKQETHALNKLQSNQRHHRQLKSLYKRVYFELKDRFFQILCSQGQSLRCQCLMRLEAH